MTKLEINGQSYQNCSWEGSSIDNFRTDNQIKNHFHSKLRKAVRKLNREIKQHLKKSTKLFKLNIIYRVVESSDYRFSDKLTIKEELFIDFNGLKNFLL